MKKKIFLLIISLGAFLLLSGCVHASTSSSLVFTDLQGAGTHTVTFSIPRDREYTPGVYTDTRDVHNNSSYFPKGYDAFAQWVVDQLPDEGYSATVDELSDGENVLIHFSYSFSSVEEYASKTRTLVGERLWAEGNFADPAIYIVPKKESFPPYDDSTDELTVTFAESSYISAACASALVELAISPEAAEAGVFLPYGDSFENADCISLYLTEYPDGAADGFFDFADIEFICSPSRACDTMGPRTCSFGGTSETVTDSSDCKISVTVPNDGTYELTDPLNDVTLGRSVSAVDRIVTDENGVSYNALYDYRPTEPPDLSLSDLWVPSDPQESTAENDSVNSEAVSGIDSEAVSGVDSDAEIGNSSSAASPDSQFRPSEKNDVSTPVMIILIISIFAASLCVIFAILLYIRYESS